MSSKTRNYPLWIAIALIVLYVGAAGIAKLAGVPYVHSSFPKLGLPHWFGYFIGTCEVLGYHATYTPILQAAPAFVLLILCGYIFWTARADMLKSRPAPSGTAA